MVIKSKSNYFIVPEFSLSTNKIFKNNWLYNLGKAENKNEKVELQVRRHVIVI